MTRSVLQTDLYQLTMAAGYFHRGLADTRATCEMFFRRLPPARRYLVLAGVEAAVDAIADLHFTEADIAFLRDEVPALSEVMTDEFCDYLRQFRFHGDVWAADEGTPWFAQAPALRVEADIIEAQLVETLLLSIINHHTMIASKAARIVRAAEGRAVLEFGTRRTHPEAAIDVARNAYLVGAVGTSNVEAGRRFGIPLSGTAAHMWTMTHDSETQAFANYVATFPAYAILLIDTYDTVRGAKRAAEVAGASLRGVRLDSGDLGALAAEVRAVLDDAGCGDTQIVASGDLNEYKIAALLDAGAPIDVFGVGTELACSKDAPALGGVYKVTQFRRGEHTTPVAKLSVGKATYPGAHQVFRRFDDQGSPVGDRIALTDEPALPGEQGLLVPQLAGGARVAHRRELSALREETTAQLSRLSAWLSDLADPETPYPVTLSSGLEAAVASFQQGQVAS
ncbi:MAG: nicotinate phosphoribosyltransferase [Myxococcota bacterium]